MLSPVLTGFSAYSVDMDAVFGEDSDDEEDSSPVKQGANEEEEKPPVRKKARFQGLLWTIATVQLMYMYTYSFCHHRRQQQ